MAMAVPARVACWAGARRLPSPRGEPSDVPPTPSEFAHVAWSTEGSAENIAVQS